MESRQGRSRQQGQRKSRQSGANDSPVNLSILALPAIQQDTQQADQCREQQGQVAKQVQAQIRPVSADQTTGITDTGRGAGVAPAGVPGMVGELGQQHVTRNGQKNEKQCLPNHSADLP